MFSSLFSIGCISFVWAQDPHFDFEMGLSASQEIFLGAQALERQRIHSPSTEELWAQFLEEDDATELLVQAELLVQRTTQDWPSGYRRDFLWDIAPAALISAKTNQIYPSVVLAQSVLESGWGRSHLAMEHNNLFGVKGQKGDRTVLINTLETVRGRVVRRNAYFRHFISWRESIAYHGRLLGSSHYYEFAKPIAQNAKHYLELIAPRYASQPDYAEYVHVIIDEYQLDRWDFLLPLFQNRQTD